MQSTKQWKDYLGKHNVRKYLTVKDAAIILQLYVEVENTETVRLVHFWARQKTRDAINQYVRKSPAFRSEAELLGRVPERASWPSYITWTDHTRNDVSRPGTITGTVESASALPPSDFEAHIVEDEDVDSDGFVEVPSINQSELDNAILSHTPMSLDIRTPPKPRPGTAILAQRGAKDVLRVSLLLALAMSLNRRGSFLSGHLLWPGSPIDASRPDPDLLRTCADLVSQLRLRIDTVLLAIMYMGSKAAASTSALTHGPWASTFACLRISEVLLYDNALAPNVWKQAAEMMDQSWKQVIHSECETLSESAPSLLILQTRWGVVTERAEHITSSLYRAIDMAFSNPGVDTESSQADWQWTKHKGEICELYRTRKLEDVMAVMKQKYGFAPSTRGYRQRLANWGIKKKPSQLLREGSEQDGQDEGYSFAMPT